MHVNWIEEFCWCHVNALLRLGPYSWCTCKLSEYYISISILHFLSWRVLKQQGILTLAAPCLTVGKMLFDSGMLFSLHARHNGTHVIQNVPFLTHRTFFQMSWGSARCSLADERWEFMFLVSSGFHIAPLPAHITLEEFFKILCGFLNDFRLSLWTHFDRSATEHSLPCPLVLYMHYGSVVSQNFRNGLSKKNDIKNFSC